jgi:hypothetical protein
MHTADKQDKFIELRAQGWSLGHIAGEIYVSKRTLVDWNRDFASDIEAFRALELELVKEKIIASREEELTRLARLQKDVYDELAHRSLRLIPIDKLFKLASDLRQEICRNDSAEPEKPRARRRCQNGRVCNDTSQSKGGDAAAHEAEAENRLPTSALHSAATPVLPSGTQRLRLDGGSNPATDDGEDGSVAMERESERKCDEPAPQPEPASAASVPMHEIAPVSPLPESSKSPQGQGPSPVSSIGPSPIAAGVPVGGTQTPPQIPLPAKQREYCLYCGVELPELLPEGDRPFLHCENEKCGRGLMPPGTSWRERCPQCGVEQPVHGANAQRPSNQCQACGANLLPLDPKSPFPWIPLTPRSIR